MQLPLTHNPTLDAVLYSLAGLALLYLGFRVGRSVGTLTASKLIAAKEQELFTTQRGFKTLYDQELAKLKEDNATLTEKVKTMEVRVEDYRKKAAGFGGLFSGGGKKADAMYALLLENEALEEALYSQNEKLKQERTDALKESMRSVGYRRVLMSQLLNDDRIKGFVAEIIGDEKRLPAPSTNSNSVSTPAE
jgi:cell division protein FtsB